MAESNGKYASHSLDLAPFLEPIQSEAPQNLTPRGQSIASE